MAHFLQVMGHRSARAKTWRWTVVVMYYMLDVSRVNSATVRRLQDIDKAVPESEDKRAPITQVTETAYPSYYAVIFCCFNIML
jgi:hypothetical protein